MIFMWRSVHSCCYVDRAVAASIAAGGNQPENPWERPEEGRGCEEPTSSLGRRADRPSLVNSFGARVVERRSLLLAAQGEQSTRMVRARGPTTSDTSSSEDRTPWTIASSFASRATTAFMRAATTASGQWSDRRTTTRTSVGSRSDASPERGPAVRVVGAATEQPDAPDEVRASPAQARPSQLIWGC